MNNMNTINKSNRDIDKKFDLVNFNQTFEENEKISTKINNITINNKLPHEKSIEMICIDMYKMIINITKLIINFKNPFPYIYSTYENHFIFAIILICIALFMIIINNLFK